MTNDIGDKCVECGCDTSQGSGKFVNRIPADRQDGVDDDLVIGWLCPDCRIEKCEMCGEEVIEFGGYDGMLVCDDCNPEWLDYEEY